MRKRWDAAASSPLSHLASDELSLPQLTELLLTNIEIINIYETDRHVEYDRLNFYLNILKLFDTRINFNTGPN